MGAGKTSIGRRVAKALGVGFTDTDIAVVRAHGPIAQIFADARRGALPRVGARSGPAKRLGRGGVVSLGGGAVLDPVTRAALDEHHVVLLTVEPATVASRIRGTARPLLQAEDAMQRWTEILQAAAAGVRGAGRRHLRHVVGSAAVGDRRDRALGRHRVGAEPASGGDE